MFFILTFEQKHFFTPLTSQKNLTEKLLLVFALFGNISRRRLFVGITTRSMLTILQMLLDGKLVSTRPTQHEIQTRPHKCFINSHNDWQGYSQKGFEEKMFLTF